ncbi:MAG: MucR family transcriptional regulator [Desulfohalobiaceae bacterium]|nr:MucR family transcriptional regulator [Desulfohalobiaceae bacterium]
MEEYVQEALEIVKAQAGVRNMTEEEISSMVKTLSESIKSVSVGAESTESTQGKQEPAVDPKKAVREKSVVCLECGKTFKVLTKRHLATHDLTPEEYKQKWGYKKNQALIAKGLARDRKKKMQEMQLWKRRKTA